MSSYEFSKHGSTTGQAVDNAVGPTFNEDRSISWIQGALVGTGSFGRIFLGSNTSTGSLLAVKQLRLRNKKMSNAEEHEVMNSALDSELRELKTFSHENLVHLMDWSIDGVTVDIFLEYVSGASIAELFRNYGAFEEPLVRNFARQTLHGLTYLHERDVIHGGLRGAKLPVDDKGGVKIADYGISKKDFLVQSNTQHSSSQNPIFWRAPEQVTHFDRAYTDSVDIWSVGCVVIEMLTAQHPWSGLDEDGTASLLASSSAPIFPSDITSDAVEFLDRTLQVDHSLRATASDLLQNPFTTLTIR